MYGIYIIKDYLSINEKNNENILDYLIKNNDYLNILIDLLNKNNKKISYEIICILINITYIDNNDILFRNINVIYKIYLFLNKNKNDKILTYEGLLLLRNITINNIEVKDMLLKYNIFEYFNEIYEIYNLDNQFLYNLILNMGNFIFNSNKEYIKQYIKIIKIIKTQINSSTDFKLLNQFIFFIYNILLFNSEEIINEIFKEEIIKKLINIYPFKINDENTINIIENEDDMIKYGNNIRILILKFIGKILSLDYEEKEESYIQKLIDCDVINFFNKIIDCSKNDFKIIKNVAFCISNICTGNYNQINKLYNEGIFIKLIEIGNNIYQFLKNNINLSIKENDINDIYLAFREICYVFSLVIINLTYEKVLPLVKYQNCIIIIFIIEALKIFQNKVEFVDLYLNSLYHLIIYDKSIEEFNYKIRVSDLNISFSEFMDRNGIKPILENIFLDKESKINKLAEKIYDSIYNKLI